jgi:hypothetical protein
MIMQKNNILDKKKDEKGNIGGLSGMTSMISSVTNKSCN